MNLKYTIFLIFFLSIIIIFLIYTEYNNPQTTTKNNYTNTTAIKSENIKIVNMNNNIELNPFQLHYDAIVVDTHNDILMPVFLKGADVFKFNAFTQSDYVKWKKGGLDVQVFSIYVPERYKTNHFNYVMKLIDKMEEYQINHSSIFSLCKSYHELEFALNEGKFCGIMGAEGGKMIEGSIDNLQILYNRGVRYLGLTWNTSNEIAISAKDENEKGIKSGLTEFGKIVVKKMNEIGMIIDVSHLSESAFWDVVSLSTSPIIASHSNCYTLAPHYRNLTDDQIKAIANSGGYIGINFYFKFIEPNANQNEITNIQSKFKNYSNNLDDSDLIAFNEQRYEFMLNNSSNAGVSIDKLIDHIDYIVKLAGIDYVGLGSDFDGSITTVNELYDATCYPILTKKLTERGYKDDEIKKILGGNFIRVFKQVCNKR